MRLKQIYLNLAAFGLPSTDKNKITFQGLQYYAWNILRVDNTTLLQARTQIKKRTDLMLLRNLPNNTQKTNTLNITVTHTHTCFLHPLLQLTTASTTDYPNVSDCRQKQCRLCIWFQNPPLGDSKRRNVWIPRLVGVLGLTGVYWTPAQSHFPYSIE
jgi:hypothetical protein